MECCYELMTFGIPTQVIPFDEEGIINLDNHQKWIRARKHLEVHTDIMEQHSLLRTVLPGPRDVLMGRDKIAQCHPGNYLYLRVIDDFQERYNNAPSKKEKGMMAVEIMNMIKESGGRFLKMDDQFGWVEAEDSLSKDKITTAFRSKRRSFRRSSKDSGNRVEKRHQNLFGDSGEDENYNENSVDGSRPVVPGDGNYDEITLPQQALTLSEGLQDHSIGKRPRFQ